MKNNQGNKEEHQGVLRLAGPYTAVTCDNGEVISIDKENLKTALQGDTVVITITDPKNKTGEIKSVIKRAKTRFVGTIGTKDNQTVVHPDDRRMYTDIRVLNPKDLEIGEKVVVNLEEWTDPESLPTGKIERTLGKQGLHNTEMESIILDKGFDTDFPPELEKEAEALKKSFAQDLQNEIQHRRDFRSVPTITIDPVDAKDFDDALSFQKTKDGLNEVGIHIADVSHYVRPGTALDKEAARRATSVYLVDRTIPMLPEVLSNNICSLRPNEDRLAFSAVFEMDDEGNIKKEWFGKTIIHSDRRMAYEEGQEVLDGNRDEFTEEITTLNRLAYKLREQKIEEGAISFEDSEVRFILDENGKPTEIILKNRTDIHKMIEDFMLLANKKVAEYASNLNKGRDHTFVYRIHDLPDIEKLGELKTFLRPFGFDLKIKDDHISQKELNNLLEKVEETPYGPMVHKATIRTMAKAIYSTKNIGHWGLAFKYYTHFTSPIRRYPDLLVHRLLEKYLNQERPKQAELASIAREIMHSTDMEIKAAEAERESIKLKQVEYMQERIGQTFSGIISGVTKWGIFVEEGKTRADGMIRMQHLGDDWFELDEKNYRIAGKKTGQSFRLGDTVKFKVIAADPNKRLLDYQLI